MVFMPIGNSKWSTAKVKIALKTYELHFRKRTERKGEKGSEEDGYFNKFPPTMPSVVLENRSIFFVISLRTTEHNLTNLTLRVFTMRYYTSVVSLVQRENGEE
jgi:hypothetical protein